MSRKDALLAAFRKAETRGLTENEQRSVAGKNFRRRRGELEAEGYRFNERKSKYHRYGKRVAYRWVLVAEPAPAPAQTAEVAMFDPPASPTSALTADVAA